jgi:Sulfatase-modifying factor enzyme 1/NACHT domain/Calcineurin-like phosphoesterase
MRFTWLHISDVHRGMLQQGWLWPNIENEFCKDLDHVIDCTGKINAIFFTGDLVQKGAPSEYRKASEMLSRLYTRLNSRGCNPVLLTVPGNHDLVRPDNQDDTAKLIDEYSANESAQEAFWNIPNNELMRAVRAAFRHYVRWEKQHPFPRPIDIRRGLLPGDFSASILIDNLQIGVVGLNTTFLQLTGGDYEGKLALHPLQMSAVCGEHYTDWFERQNVSLLLTHQPPSWLDRRSREFLNGEICIPERFVGHLCGHLHENYSQYEIVGGQPRPVLWQASSLCGLETLGTGLARRHGYSIGSIVIDGVDGIARTWPRRAERHQNGHWRFVPDNTATLENDEGMPGVGFTVHSIASASISQRFSVLIISTDADLKTTRSAVAEHLRRSLGVSVTEAAKADRVNEFNLVVLLQAFWWGNGDTAATWRAVTEEKRVAIVSDENSDWPPHRMMDIPGYAFVRSFRSELLAGNGPSFLRPEQLPEIIGNIVTSRLEQMQGSEALGMRSWERAYLDFRIPAWRAGRTALSQPHLFDAEDAKELYQPDLYTTLDGTSAQWRRGPDGTPWRITEKPHRKKNSLSGTGVVRVKLAKWISVPDLPRIALIGAPGGGKTIFITRIAAAVANACLGRAVDFEPDLDVEKLRRGGMLPVPVVVEATRIAMRDASHIGALVEAMVDEIGAAGTRPPAEEVHKGLREGRYLLLIDALDEIADGAQRARVLTLLKGMAGENVLPATRMVLTTRSARYTGRLRFAPELESVEVAPLDSAQLQALCTNWSRHRQRDDEYRGLLMAAVLGLADRVGSKQGDQALTENPLMLTAICMVFERYRSLPDDRGRLCDLLIDDLCRSRRSEDLQRGWQLDESGKKDLLQRIALAMQEEGAQSWPFARAVEIAMQLVPTADGMRQQRARRYVDWAADHTGILRFQDAKDDEEQIRFWHRLFREYLSANQIAQEDSTAGDKIDRLWKEQRLLDPFWEDVVRLLPRALGTMEKARSMRQRLEQLAEENPASRGRLLGLAAAAIIENRDLYPDVNFAEMADRMARLYDEQGDSWRILDRLLFLDALGRLDTKRGDPRLIREGWIEAKGGGSFVLRYIDVPSSFDILISWKPVTVHEFAEFLNSQDFYKDVFWSGMSTSVVSRRDRSLHARIHRQLRFPNRPVVNVSFCEALAFTRWKSSLRPDGLTVRLPYVSEWQRLASTSDWKGTSAGVSTPLADAALFNSLAAGLDQPTPVGAFPLRVCGGYDVIGNVWEWALPNRLPKPRLMSRREVKSDRRYIPTPITVVGGAFNVSCSEGELVAHPPLELVRNGYPSIGFRCVLAKSDVAPENLQQILELAEYSPVEIPDTAEDSNEYAQAATEAS